MIFPHEYTCFSMVSVFHWVPPIWGFFLASWLLAGLLLASWLLASSFPTRISLENRFFKGFAKPVNSLHENTCFFNGFGVSWGPPPFGASSWPLAGLLASCCLLASFLLASCLRQPLAGFLLASCWPLGFLLASCWPLGLLLASCWPLGFLLLLLASCCLLAGFLLASCLLACCSPLAGFLASCCLLAGLLLASGCLLACASLLLASCWPLGFWFLASPMHSLENRFCQRARKTGEFSS